ncbi:hypothetical protein [Candidatus Amarolinea dominans]|uniref:hypothetical protein n=1 Tax=Candidatus Amarolinea dominans TaxID=3140696 RepID=UPI0031356519|nr:hypothetical protein [Anaerolineae bacterium]
MNRDSPAGGRWTSWPDARRSCAALAHRSAADARLTADGLREEWLLSRRAAHEQRTAEIIRLETQLNARVYGLFDLGAAEIELIEASTKYRYGEV